MFVIDAGFFFGAALPAGGQRGWQRVHSGLAQAVACHRGTLLTRPPDCAHLALQHGSCGHYSCMLSLRWERVWEHVSAGSNQPLQALAQEWALGRMCDWIRHVTINSHGGLWHPDQGEYSGTRTGMPVTSKPQSGCYSMLTAL